jgi:hypothetical protein
MAITPLVKIKVEDRWARDYKYTLLGSEKGFGVFYLGNTKE